MAEKIIKEQGKDLPKPVVKDFDEVKKTLDTLNKQGGGRQMIDCEGFANISKILIKAEKNAASEAKKSR